jgi:hypothetical protein
MGFLLPIMGRSERASIKVFDQTGAATGYSEALCAKKGRAYQSVMIERNQHAGYYPGASLLTLKVIFDPKEGTLLGAQAIGHDGAEKRIDVIATAIAGGLKVQDLMDLELSYAPPYGSAKDPVNIAGYAASNLLTGAYRQIRLTDVADGSQGCFARRCENSDGIPDGAHGRCGQYPLCDLTTKSR